MHKILDTVTSVYLKKCAKPQGGRRVQGRGSDIVLKWIVAGPEINKLHEFEGVQGK